MPAATLTRVVAYVRRLSETEPSSLSDGELLRRFHNLRDEAAFAEVVRRHGPMLLATCRRVLRHEQDAEDAFQAAFLVLARKAESIRCRDSVGGWLHEVAFRIAIRARKANARRANLIVPLAGDPASREADSRQESLISTLDAEIARLPEAYRSVVVLCYLEGRSQREAAEMLATTTDSVNSRLKRARATLRERLAIHGAPFVPAALPVAAETLVPAVVAKIARVATLFLAGSAPAGGPTALALGALQASIAAKLKLWSVLTLVIALMSAAFLMPTNAQQRVCPTEKASLTSPVLGKKAGPKEGAGKKPRRAIIVWLSGGPSQIDTFDPKTGDNALFKPIDTNVKGLQLSETLPLLAKQANHLAILRGVNHRNGDHGRAAHLMNTGFEPGAVEYPAVGSVLAKELGDASAKAPRLVRVGPPTPLGTSGPGILGRKYAALPISTLELPPVKAFAGLDVDMDKAGAMRKAIAGAFDLGAEAADLRAAYGTSRFGKSCLLARRLLEAGVPVVEVSMDGWDMHANLAASLKTTAGNLDAGLATLIKDLHQRKLLDSTLVVCMGEFGRTPIVNVNGGRDHWPQSFSVVLAGSSVKGGQAIGKTSAEGTKITERPVSPQELLATIYTAAGIDPYKKNRSPDGHDIPLVERGANAVKEALR